MHSEKDGKLICEVKVNKKKVIIYFEDESSLEVTPTTYTHFYLYKDKTLTSDEIRQIKHFDEISLGRDYVVNLVSNHLYTEKQVYDKLINVKHISPKNAFEIVNSLKEYGYVNDNNYVNEMFEVYTMKNYGKNKIITKLLQAGIDKSLIEELSFDDEEEYLKASNDVESFIKGKINTKSKKKLMETTYSHLCLNGFSSLVANEAIKIIEDSFDEQKEIETLLKGISKYMLTHEVNLKNYEEKQKLINTFIRKGYSYDMINNCVEELTQNEEC